MFIYLCIIFQLTKLQFIIQYVTFYMIFLHQQSKKRKKTLLYKIKYVYLQFEF